MNHQSTAVFHFDTPVNEFNPKKVKKHTRVIDDEEWTDLFGRYSKIVHLVVKCLEASPFGDDMDDWNVSAAGVHTWLTSGNKGDNSYESRAVLAAIPDELKAECFKNYSLEGTRLEMLIAILWLNNLKIPDGTIPRTKEALLEIGALQAAMMDTCHAWAFDRKPHIKAKEFKKLKPGQVIVIKSIERKNYEAMVIEASPREGDETILAVSNKGNPQEDLIPIRVIRANIVHAGGTVNFKTFVRP